MESVLIRGDGVAAYCCAHLLRRAGFRVAFERLDRPRVPAIMIGDTALALIRDVFDRPSLFSELPRIERRVVVWGDDSLKTFPHSAVVVSENYLLESLGSDRSLTVTAQKDVAAQKDGEFTILTSRPLPPNTTERKFGSRRAAAARVTLRDPADLRACRIESLEAGWLFLIPNGLESTWLLAVGGPVETLLGASLAIAPLLDRVEAATGEFPTCPRILSPVCGDNWLACGSVAMAFDPICGDGTAHAVREAILASAVLRGIADGGDRASLLLHYQSCTIAAVRRHLKLCADFYGAGGSGEWWQTELKSLVEGHAWCTSELGRAGEPRYELRGFDLVPRAILTANPA